MGLPILMYNCWQLGHTHLLSTVTENFETHSSSIMSPLIIIFIIILSAKKAITTLPGMIEYKGACSLLPSWESSSGISL